MLLLPLGTIDVGFEFISKIQGTWDFDEPMVSQFQTTCVRPSKREKFL